VVGIDAGACADELVDVQRRLLLVLRSRHGPDLPQVWMQACSRAGVIGTGQLGPEELERVCQALLARGGLDAVAAGSAQVRLVFLRRKSAAPAAVPTYDDQVRAALHEPDALDEQVWRRRLAEIEAEFLGGAPGRRT
jgi:hypothetical protein